MTADSAGDFVGYLAQGDHSGAGLSPTSPSGAPASPSTLRKIWESTDLTAGDFADAVARFYRLTRVSLPQLMSATPLVKHFSPRFLREMAVVPYHSADGTECLAVGDPTDMAGLRAAEIVLGAPVTLTVASFEDIATVLAERLGEPDEAPAETGDPVSERAAEDIDNLRDLASGAPVVRAVNDLLEKAVELRASDIHIGPFRTGLEVRMRVDGLLRPVAAPAGVLPQAVISRIKILAGLDIAERRLPQDGAARLRIGRDEIDVRVAIMPTQHGEAAVIRLLAKDRGLLSIDKLGLAPAIAPS